MKEAFRTDIIVITAIEPMFPRRLWHFRVESKNFHCIDLLSLFNQWNDYKNDITLFYRFILECDFPFFVILKITVKKIKCNA